MESLIEYAKLHFPKVTFKKVNFENGMGDRKKAIGFVVTDTHLVIGYISKDGNLRRLLKPINLTETAGVDLEGVINQIPIVEGFLESDKIRLIELINSKKKAVDLEYQDLLKKFGDLENNYNVLVSTSKNRENELELKIVQTEAAQKEELEIVKKSFIEQFETCKNKILEEKETVIKAIQEYRDQMQKFVTKNAGNTELMKKAIERMKSEREIMITRLNALSANSGNETVEIKRLNELISKLQEDLIKNTTEATQFKTKCLEQILYEKNTIIDKIKNYNESWSEWSKKNVGKITDQRETLAKEVRTITEQLKEIFRFKKEYVNKLQIEDSAKDQLIQELNSNLASVKSELNKVLEQQLTIMNTPVPVQETPVQDPEIVCQNKNVEITQLRNELERVNSLLQVNANTPIATQVTDYSVCYNALYKFTIVNNSFFRKQQIINILDRILGAETVATLTQEQLTSIRTRYQVTRNAILQTIQFLNLQRFANSPYTRLSPQNASQIPAEFCAELANVNKYWDESFPVYRAHDRELTNIYEDLAGTVRVYIKIKPLSNGVPGTVSIGMIQNKKQKKVFVECPGKKETFGDFFGVFEDNFSNLDTFVGVPGNGESQNGNFTIPGIETFENSLDTVSPGLYNTFKQVEDGYSIVLFGYGTSGSGKSFSLIGQNNQSVQVPGVIHYGLGNLNGVSNIRVKNVFEQYVDTFKPTLNLVTGKIINLIGKVPRLSEFSEDESQEFSGALKQSGVSLESFSANELFSLTSVIEKYRISKQRVKKTPNNPVSSRSHLYLVFEITFTTGNTGYITVVDMGGRESPTDLFNLFIDNQTQRYRTTLTTILGPTGGPNVISQYLKPEFMGKYTPDGIYNIFKEGFYINETINHLIYFFNRRNYSETKVVKQTSLEKYSISKYYINPVDEEKMIKPTNNALTIPIMKYLDALGANANGGSVYKPTKWVTLVCLRKEEQYCDQIFSSIKFAVDIKST